VAKLVGRLMAMLGEMYDLICWEVNGYVGGDGWLNLLGDGWLGWGRWVAMFGEMDC
jgi:hypothetical protein